MYVISRYNNGHSIIYRANIQLFSFDYFTIRKDSTWLVTINSIYLYMKLNKNINQQKEQQMEKYTANKDMNIKYIYSLGGGIKGRTIKKGEIVTKTGEMYDINTKSVSTLELLNRVELNSFMSCFTKIQIIN